MSEKYLEELSRDDYLAKAHSLRLEGKRVESSILCIKAHRAYPKDRWFSSWTQTTLHTLTFEECLDIVKKLFPDNVPFLRLLEKTKDNIQAVRFITAFLIDPTYDFSEIVHVTKELSKEHELLNDFIRNEFDKLIEEGDEPELTTIRRNWSNRREALYPLAESISLTIQAQTSSVTLRTYYSDGKGHITGPTYHPENIKQNLTIIIKAMLAAPDNISAQTYFFDLILNYVVHCQIEVIDVIQNALPQTQLFRDTVKLFRETMEASGFSENEKKYLYLLLGSYITQGAPGLIRAINRIALNTAASSADNHKIINLLSTFIAKFHNKIEEEQYRHVKIQFDKEKENEFLKPSIDIGDFDFNDVSRNNYNVIQIILLMKFKLINATVQDEKTKNTFLHHLIVNENSLLEKSGKLSLLVELHAIGQLKSFVALQDSHQQTLAILTARIPNPQSAEILRLLAAAGTNFATRDEKGNTALHYCALLGSINNLSVIIAGKSITEIHALFQFKNEQGKTVYQIIQENYELLSQNKEQLQQQILTELSGIAVAGKRSKNVFGNFFRDKDFQIVFVSKKFSEGYQETAPIDECCGSMKDDPALILHPTNGMDVAALFEKQETGEVVFVDRHGHPVDQEVFFNMKTKFKNLDQESLLEWCIKGVELCYQRMREIQKSDPTQKYYQEPHKSSHFQPSQWDVLRRNFRKTYGLTAPPSMQLTHRPDSSQLKITLDQCDNLINQLLTNKYHIEKSDIRDDGKTIIIKGADIERFFADHYVRAEKLYEEARMQLNPRTEMSPPTDTKSSH